VTVPSCSTCRHAVPHRVSRATFLRCAHPSAPPHVDCDAWFASVVRGFATDEHGNPWCGPMGAWHEAAEHEDQTA